MLDNWQQIIFLILIFGLPALQWLIRTLAKIYVAMRDRAAELEKQRPQDAFDRRDPFDPDQEVEVLVPDEVITDRRREFMDEPQVQVPVPVSEPVEPRPRRRGTTLLDEITEVVRELADPEQRKPEIVPAPEAIWEPEPQPERPSLVEARPRYMQLEATGPAVAPHDTRGLSKDSILYPPTDSREFARLFVWSEILKPPLALREDDSASPW